MLKLPDGEVGKVFLALISWCWLLFRCMDYVPNSVILRPTGNLKQQDYELIHSE